MSDSYQQDDDHHESNHEYNMFLDREIQKKLLALSEKIEASDVLSFNNSKQPQSTTPFPQTPTAGKRPNRARLPKFEEFCSWMDAGKLPKEPVNRRGDKTYRLSRDKESTNNLWKEFKPKEIHYIFKHYNDTTRYIEQYRYDHTYNFGPLSREPIEITTCKIVPLRDTPSPNYKAGSEHEHHNPFRRSRDFTQSQLNLHEQDRGGGESNLSNLNNGLNQVKKLSFSKSESNLPEVAQRYRDSPNVVNNSSIKDGSSASQKEKENDDHSVRSLSSAKSDTSSKNKTGHLVKGLPSSKNNDNNNKTYSKNGEHGSKTARAATPKAVALDTVPKMTPMQILQVKKSGHTLNTGVPLFQGKTMKVAKSNGHISQGENNTQSSPHKMPQVKSGSFVSSSLVLPAGKMKTLDVLTSVSAIDPHQDQSTQNGAAEPDSPDQSGSGSQPAAAGAQAGGHAIKETASVMEASQNLKQGTDKENYQSLVSELSYLDISQETSAKQHNSNKDKNYDFLPALDVTGLTVAFAQKYDIRELGMGNGYDPDKDENKQFESGSDSGKGVGNDFGQEKENGDPLLHRNNEEDSKNQNGKSGGKILAELNTNRVSPDGDNRQEIQFEKVNKSRNSDQRNDEIQKINEIKSRMSKKKELKIPFAFTNKKNSSQFNNNPKGNAEHLKNEKKLQDLRDECEDDSFERQRSRVTFNMNPEVIDFTEDDEAIRRPEISSPDIMKPSPMLPYLEQPISPYASIDRKTPTIPNAVNRSFREVTPDKATIMRRYFMDIAEKEGNKGLLQRLQQAPDQNFKPLSAGDAQAKIKTKYRVSLDELNGSRDEKALSSPSGRYMYSMSPTSRPSLQYYNKVAKNSTAIKAASRQKSFYNQKPNIVAESDKRFLKDLNKLSKLKEIYLKSREKSIADKNELLKGKNKPAVSVLQKMQSGHEEMEGVLSI